MGYRRGEAPGVSHGDLTDEGEPYPVVVFGESKPISSRKIGRYLTDDVFYYINVYENNRTFGIPYRNWIEMPEWMIELHRMLSGIEREHENWRLSRNGAK